MAHKNSSLAAAARLFSALGDENRLRLVARLCEEGPLSISQLTEGTDITRQAITKHLEAMKDVGLTVAEKRGREKIWTLEEKRLEIAQKYLELTSRRWDSAITRLKDLVEK